MTPRHTSKVREVKQRLVERLRNGTYRPGDRFLSNRDVAELYGISYQTAHRLIGELCQQGHLERRPQSGTYVPGGAVTLTGAQLIFASRADRPQSFGAKLLDTLTRRFDAQEIVWTRADAEGCQLDPQRIPIIWESPSAVELCLRAQRQAILINDRPRGGLQALYVDSVSTDDFLGGVYAGELLRSRTRNPRRCAILAGTSDDPRIRLRMQGCLSVLSASLAIDHSRS